MTGLSFRDIGTDDLDALSGIVGHWEVVRQLGSFPWPPDAAFTAKRAQTYRGDGFVWAILRDGTVIGTVAVTEEVLGYMLHPAQWGQGIMGHAARRAVAHAFQQLGRDRIVAEIWADNTASRRVLERLGFELVLSELVMSGARGTLVASHRLVLTRPRWESLSKARQSAKPVA